MAIVQLIDIESLLTYECPRPKTYTCQHRHAVRSLLTYECPRPKTERSNQIRVGLVSAYL